MDFNNPHSKPWYFECTDRCGKCFGRGLLLRVNETFFFVKCKKCGNTSKSAQNKGIALANWNIKQRRIRGKI
jgi:hypothetical protein